MSRARTSTTSYLDALIADLPAVRYERHDRVHHAFVTLWVRVDLLELPQVNWESVLKRALMLLMIKSDTGSPPCGPSRHRRRPCCTPQSPGHPQQQWKTWWPGIGESCWESLPPKLCVDALGGHLARRWGALLRHLRLPRLGHQA